MSNKIWFKKKRYGWGWTPSSVEGWLCFVLFSLGSAVYPVLAKYHYISFSIFIFSTITIALALILICICYKKGEKPSWQWGEKK